MLGRREFIQRAAVATALLGIPKARAEEAFARRPDALPPLKLLDTDLPEALIKYRPSSRSKTAVGP